MADDHTQPEILETQLYLLTGQQLLGLLKNLRWAGAWRPEPSCIFGVRGIATAAQNGADTFRPALQITYTRFHQKGWRRFFSSDLNIETFPQPGAAVHHDEANKILDGIKTYCIAALKPEESPTAAPPAPTTPTAAPGTMGG